MEKNDEHASKVKTALAILGDGNGHAHGFARDLADAIGGEISRSQQVFDRPRRAVFLAALTRGLSLTRAAKLAGVSAEASYHARKTDKTFLAACDAAREAGASEAEDVLDEIMRDKSEPASARVRAATELLRHRTGRAVEHQSPAPAPITGRARLTNAQGASFELQLGPPLDDEPTPPALPAPAPDA